MRCTCRLTWLTRLTRMTQRLTQLTAARVALALHSEMGLPKQNVSTRSSELLLKGTVRVVQGEWIPQEGGQGTVMLKSVVVGELSYVAAPNLPEGAQGAVMLKSVFVGDLSYAAAPYSPDINWAPYQPDVGWS